MPLITEPGRTFVDDSNRILSVGTVRFAEPGTGAITLKTTYPTHADLIAGTNANANPMTIGLDGRLPNQAHGNGTYRVIVRDVLTNTISDDSDVNAGLAQSTGVVGTISYPVVDSIAALKALDVANSTRAFVIGYYAANDGGGGQYRLNGGSSATDNGGTIIQPTSGSGRWELLHQGMVTCKQFGAKGDDATDNNVLGTLQKWITAAVTDGFIAQWVKGTFLNSTRLTATGPIHMRGSGWDCILKLTSAAAVIALFVEASAFGAVPGCVFENFCIDGNSGGQYNAALLNLNGATGAKVSHLLVKNGSRVSGTDGVNGISMAAGDPTGVGSTGTIEFCEVTNMSKAGINISGSSAAFGEKILIHGNDIHDITGNGSAPAIQINAGGRVTASYNNIKTIQGSAYLITDGSGNDADIDIISGTIDGACASQTTECAGVQASAGTIGNIARLKIRGLTCINTGTDTNVAAAINCSKIKNLIIESSICRFNKGDALRLTACEVVNINGGQFVSNSQTPAITYTGAVQLLGACGRVKMSGTQCTDDQGTATQSYALIIGTGAVVSNLSVDESNQFSGNKNGPFLCQGSVTSGRVAFTAEVQTTGASTTTLCQIIPTASTRVQASLKVIGAKAAADDVGMYMERKGVFYRQSGGTTTQQDSTAIVSPSGTTAEDVKTDATWGSVTMAVSTPEIVMQVAGKAATTINWRGAVVFDLVA